MTASEKITQRILLDAENEAKIIIEAAEKEAENIRTEGKAKADLLCAELKSAADKKAEGVNESALSAAKLSIRNAVLLNKRQEIDKTLDALCDYFVSLPDKEYFDVLVSLAKKFASSGNGVMMLNSKDLERKPKTFDDEVKKLNITVSEKADDSIGGGFILKYNDIEQNADFKALITEKKEQLTDIINKEIF